MSDHNLMKDTFVLSSNYLKFRFYPCDKGTVKKHIFVHFSLLSDSVICVLIIAVLLKFLRTSWIIVIIIISIFNCNKIAFMTSLLHIHLGIPRKRIKAKVVLISFVSCINICLSSLPLTLWLTHSLNILNT